MKFISKNPPREFSVGHNAEIQLKDCGTMKLAANEQITFITESGAEYDVARKPWGFYATPSLNNRLRKFGLRGALIKGADNKFFIFLVEKEKEELFEEYLKKEGLKVVAWLDSDKNLAGIENYFSE